MNRKEKEYIRELKIDKSTGKIIENNLFEGYKIRIIERGERLFYQQKEKALICEIQIRNGSIFSSSIKKWDDDSIVTEEEKRTILERIKSYFINYQQITFPIIR